MSLLSQKIRNPRWDIQYSIGTREKLYLFYIARRSAFITIRLPHLKYDNLLLFLNHVRLFFATLVRTINIVVSVYCLSRRM